MSRRLLLVLWLLVAAITLPAQEQWSVRHLTPMDGLPQNSVVSMVQESDGHLLLSTEGGLVRFDGSRFRRVPLQGDDGTMGGRTRTLIQLADGSIALRDARNKLYRVGMREAVPFDPPISWVEDMPEVMGGFPGPRILALAGNPAGPMGRWHMPMTTFVPLSGEDWAVLTEGRLMVFRDTAQLGDHPVPSRSEAMMTGPKGLYLIGQYADGVRMDPLTGQSSPIVAHGLPRLRETRWRWHWRPGARRGFLSIDDRIWEVHIDPTGDSLLCSPLEVPLPKDSRVMAVVEDEANGMIAVGTGTDGLYLFRTKPIRTVTTDGFNSFYGQAMVASDMLIAANMDQSAAFHLSGEPYDPLPAFVLSSLSLGLDAQGRVLFSHRDALPCYDPATGRMDTIQDRNLHSSYSFLAEGDSVWVASPGGMGYVKGDRYHSVSALVGRGWAAVPTDLCRGPGGELLAASCNGLFIIDTDGMPQRVEDFTGRCPRTLEPFGDRVFVGTFGDGAFVVDPQGIHHLPLDRKGFLSHVHAFLADGSGNLWMSTNQGLFRTRMAEIDAWLEDTTRAIYYGHYGEEDGIQNPEFNGGCTPGHLVLPNGVASFPSMGGLVWFRPEEVPDTYPLAPVRAVALFVDGAEHPLDSALVLPSDHHELRVSFGLVHWGSPDQVQLESDLDGTGWTPLEEDVREMVLQRLPAGPHVLRIRKVGSDVRGDDGSLELRFAVAYPYYRTWWWMLCMLLILVGLFYLAVRWNAARLNRLNLALERSVEQRTEALQKANDDLRHWVEVKETLVSVISHDIVAPLRFIARTSSNAAREGDEQQRTGTLKDIAHSSDRLHSHAQNLLNWVKHQQGHLQVRLLHIPLNALVDEIIEVMRLPAESKGLELVNAVSFEDVLRSDRDILSVVIQNLVSNAVAHTVKGGIRVEGEVRGEEYHLIVKDTGTGMPLPMRTWILNTSTGQGELPERPKGEGHGLGYLIIKALLPLIGAQLEIESTASEGSSVHVVLPLSM